MDKDEQLTRQEISALITAAEKSADAMSKVAERLQVGNAMQEKIISLQDRLLAELSNGLPKRVVEPVLEQTKAHCQKLDLILGDQREMKWLVRSIGAVIGFVGLEKLGAALLSIVKP